MDESKEHPIFERLESVRNLCRYVKDELKEFIGE